MTLSNASLFSGTLVKTHGLHMGSPRLYLDNAATSWPKPDGVYEAVADYQRRLGAAVGRGGYEEARQVADLVELQGRESPI